MDPMYDCHYPAKRRRVGEPSSTVEPGNYADDQPSLAFVNPFDGCENSSLPSLQEQASYPVDIAQDTIVCFGMIPAISSKCDRRLPGIDTFPVKLDSAERFTAEHLQIRGAILPDHGHMVQGLLEEETLQLFVSCHADAEQSERKTSNKFTQSPCALEITVYGPWELFDNIGKWFQDYDVYLQDPRMCHLDVRYCNPHKLSSDDIQSCPLLAEVVSGSWGPVHFQDVIELPDLLDILSGQNDLEEAPQPTFIKAVLHRHQKQALTFMLRRERGWFLDEEGQDIWQILDTSQGRHFINRISNAHQAIAPPQFFGGIIADPMGLGKTLTMIALAATDLEAEHMSDDEADPNDEDKQDVHATLIIVPQPLLGTWEEQLCEHVIEGGIKFARHHSKSKLANILEIEAVNVVLTTYHTLSADWKAWKANGSHIMFQVRWRRIILDEAHVVRNMRSRMARAVCELDALSRWAVTGTPIQNHLNDLAALLKFIRAHPYHDPKRFEDDISRLWKSGEDEEAVKRLKRLASCLILRRAKRTINLPQRRDAKCPVDFTKSERALYDKIRQQAITKIDDALLHESELSTSGIYVNFLQQIESMRLVCNLGLHYHARHEKPATQEVSDWMTVAQETFNIHREMEPIACSQCSSTLELTETFLDEPIQDNPLFSRCLKYTCIDCAHRLHLTGHKMVCGHTPRCPVAPISISHSAFEETMIQLPQPSKPSSAELPSKVQALVTDLRSLPSDIKSIVFSTWRLTLDLVESGLSGAGIRSVRFDGKVPQAQRQSVLNQFKADPTIRVMLLTLSCGAVGLTLTEASRAYLMEPHWNPTIEEQALARIHRIGQMREVTTVRFYIRDSFEERVMEVQESKKNLAGVLLSGHDGGHADDSLGALQRLRSLL